MITKTNAVKMSVRKWEKIIKKLEREEPVTWEITGLSCGFCYFFRTLGRYNGCLKCPLFPDICTEDREGSKSLFWRFSEEDSLELARQILEAIRVRGEKWIKGEK